ncbi:MAG: alpha/beta hydrolase [Verrucomicrobiota bacterium]
MRNALSLGGAVSICTAAENPHVKTLVTWSAVPKFADWIKGVVNADGKIEKNPIHGGPGRSTDHPRVDVPEAYVSLKIPKLQIQGDRDLAGFREGFETYFPAASAPKKHVVLPGADHVFTTWRDRQKVIRHTVKWFQKYL